MSQLLDLLEAKHGIVCAVGAGGKKTLLYRLVSEHPGRVGYTATVQVARFPENLRGAHIVEHVEQIGERVFSAARTSRVVAFARPGRKPDRLAGIDPSLVSDLHAGAGFDATFVKADGARMRSIKVPRPWETVLPGDETTVVPIVSGRVFGRPLAAEIAHRVDLVTEITGTELGDVLEPTHVALLIASDRGALHRVGTATVVPLINITDSACEIGPALAAARQALEMSQRLEKVVVAALLSDTPVVEVVYR